MHTRASEHRGTQIQTHPLHRRPGKAVAGYIWYRKKEDDTWENIGQGNLDIGTGHISYTAEAIALRMGLDNDPMRHIMPNRTHKRSH